MLPARALSDTARTSLTRAPYTAQRPDKMDSNSNSMDAFLPKLEVTDHERECYRITRPNWNSENTKKLIEMLENECNELWNIKNPGYKSKAIKLVKYEYLAETFGTTVEEITRKVHNLRTQFNNELRKIRRRQEVEGVAGGSGWEYFDALSFLKMHNVSDLGLTPDPLELDAVNLELAEFQADEEEEFRNAPARALKAAAQSSGQSSSPVRKRPVLRVAASAPPPLPASAHPLMWPEQPVPSLRPSVNADECQIFGDFVASELRTLRSNESRKKLKRMIQKAILKIGEEEDINITSEPKRDCHF